MITKYFNGLAKPITFNQLCSFSANLYEFNMDDFGYLKDCINKRGFYYYYDGDYMAEEPWCDRGIRENKE